MHCVCATRMGIYCSKRLQLIAIMCSSNAHAHMLCTNMHSPYHFPLVLCLLLVCYPPLMDSSDISTYISAKSLRINHCWVASDVAYVTQSVQASKKLHCGGWARLYSGDFRHQIRTFGARFIRTSNLGASCPPHPKMLDFHGLILICKRTQIGSTHYVEQKPSALRATLSHVT